MKLIVKTLTGKNFPIDVDPTSSVGAVKQLIETTNSAFPAAQQKLIHAGKVLKDDAVLADSGIVEDNFLVVMLTKPKKAAPAAAPAPAPTPTPAPGGAAEPAATTTAPAATTTTTPAATSTPAPAPAAPAPAPSAAPAVSAAALQPLTEMGFPEAEARAALEAAARVGGGQDLAVEFLMNGIPPNFPPAGAGPPPMSGAGASPAGGAAGNPLASLRNHPQFDQLRQLVQTNPAALEPVLQQIGQQSPGLLEYIRNNQAQFLQMLNEPVEPTPAAPTGAMPPMGGAPGGMPPGMGQGPSAQQLTQLFMHVQSLPPAQRDMFAQQLGIPPQQLQAMTQMMSSMSPEQLQAMLGMMGGGGGGMPGMPPGGIPPGANVIHVTQQEMEAVTRLTELGFSQQEAMQAYLACDKDEALAANFLFENGAFGAGGPGAAAMPPPAAATPAPATTPAPAPATTQPTAQPDAGAGTAPQQEGGDQQQQGGGDQSGGSGDQPGDEEDMYS